MKCKGYWDICNCSDCQEVKEMYEELEWLERDNDFNRKIIEELIRKIENLGYSV